MPVVVEVPDDRDIHAQAADLADHLGDVAASSVLTVTRTSSEPACARRATWIAVASASAVSVFVIDWTTIGWSPPTGMPPTSTVIEFLRIVASDGVKERRVAVPRRGS